MIISVNHITLILSCLVLHFNNVCELIRKWVLSFKKLSYYSSTESLGELFLWVGFPLLTEIRLSSAYMGMVNL